MIKKNKTTSHKLYTRPISLMFFGAILFFVCIFIIDKNDIPSRLGIVDDSNSAEWRNNLITFFGTIIGAYIGFMGAIMAVSLTVGRQDEMRKEDSRKNVLPLIRVTNRRPKTRTDFDLCPFIELPNDNQVPLLLAISFKNVGQREMYDIHIGNISGLPSSSNRLSMLAPILYKGDEYHDIVTSAILRDPKITSIHITAKIYYKDCYDNWYYQEIEGSGKGSCKTCYRIEKFEIRSAPVLLSEYELNDLG